jgi:hypothetical protein
MAEAGTMGLISRRNFLKGASALGAGTVGVGGYALGVEPNRISVARYALTPPGWPAGQRVTIAAIADLHACDPWMPMAQIERIVAETNALKADLVVLLGDYESNHRLVKRRVASREWAPELGRLTAPLGVHAVLGNHDWWDDREAQRRGHGPVSHRRAIEKAGIPVYENDAVKLTVPGGSFWLAGLGDQWAFHTRRIRRKGQARFGYRGVDDLEGTLAKVPAGEPVILMAHEPDIFADMDSRVALTLSGHTHGGQISVMGYVPMVPSMYGRRFAYGHIVEDERHLIVSGGLGCSGMPVRFGVPPEIVLIELGV